MIMNYRRISSVAFVSAAGLMLVACQGGKESGGFEVPTGGVASRGVEVIHMKGCGGCHTIPGINDAHGLVGPPLFFFARRTYIAGEVANKPDNLVHWVMNPQSIEPHTAMPNLGLTEQQARDVAAYLYTLR